MNLKTILVPLDGSTVAETALAPAVALAREAGAKLVLVRAAEVRTLPLGDPIADQTEVMREAQEYLATVRARVMAAGALDVEVSAWYGPAVEAIVEAAGVGAAGLRVGNPLVLQPVRGEPILVIRPDGAPLDTLFRGASSAKEVSHA